MVSLPGPNTNKDSRVEINLPAPSPFAQTADALDSATIPRTDRAEAREQVRIDSVREVIDNMVHEGARETLNNYIEYLQSPSGGSKTEYQASSAVNSLLQFSRNRNGDLPWDNAKDPSAVAQDRIHKMILNGNIPESCAHQMDASLHKLNPAQFERQAIGDQLESKRAASSNRMKAAQAEFRQQEQDKYDNSVKELIDSLPEGTRRARAIHGQQVSRDLDPDSDRGRSAARVLERVEADDKARKPFSREGAQTYFVDEKVAARLATPVNLEAMRRFSPEELAATKQAAPKQVAQNEIPTPERLNETLERSKIRFDSAKKSAAEYTKAIDSMRESNGGRESITKLEAAREICREVGRQELALAKVTKELQRQRISGDMRGIQDDIKQYSSLLDGRSGLNDKAVPLLSEAKSVVQSEQARKIKLASDFNQVKDLYKKFLAAAGDEATLAQLDQQIDQVKANGVSFDTWTQVAESAVASRDQKTKSYFDEFKTLSA